MTYNEKKAELNALLQSVEKRIRSQDVTLRAIQARYGRHSRMYGYGPSYGLLSERTRLERELEGLEYEQAARCAAATGES